MELVSVIIPVYNREKTIEEAVRSVLVQTYANLEILVVDDCSTDSTVAVVENIRDDRIRIIRCEKNGGACKARNMGIENAKGEFIAFHDSDDTWHKDKLEKSMYYLQKENVDFVFSALWRKELKSDKKKRIPSYDLNAEKDKLSRILISNCVSTQTIVLKKKVCSICCFDVKLPRFQDWDFAIQVLKAGFKVYYIDEPLVDCVVLSDSITSNPEKGRIALEILEHKYAKEYEKDKNARKGFYFHAAVLMEKWGLHGTAYFKESYDTENGMGMYIRYWMAKLRIYRPINIIVDKFIG